MTKQERAIKARAHYEDIKTRLAANTKLSIERTYVYGIGRGYNLRGPEFPNGAQIPECE